MMITCLLNLTLLCTCVVLCCLSCHMHAYRCFFINVMINQAVRQLNNQCNDIKSDMDALEGCLICLNFIKASVINSATVLLLLSFTMVNLDSMCSL